MFVVFLLSIESLGGGKPLRTGAVSPRFAGGKGQDVKEVQKSESQLGCEKTDAKKLGRDDKMEAER